LLYGDGVQAGKGGFFKVCSGETTTEELAAVHDKVFATKVDVTREGSVEDLEAGLARLRKEKRMARSIEYKWESAAVLASKGLWENKDVTVQEQFKKPTSLEVYFREEKSKGQHPN
jgi:G3E family GTPase